MALEANCHKLPPPGRWYQEAVINGVEMPRRRQEDTNEERWRTFIEPFMWNGQEQRFVELGCNAGFYLRKARGLGFEAIGVDNDPTYLAQARYWEANDPKGVQIFGEDLRYYGIPACHVLLLANVHYWLHSRDIRKLEKKFQRRAMNVIVIGRHRPLRQHNSPCELDKIVKYFPNWEATQGGSDRKHYSIMFKNPKMAEMDINSLYIFDPPGRNKRIMMVPALLKLIDAIDQKQLIIPIETDYYKYLRWLRVARSKKKQLMKRHIGLINDIKKRGIVKPLYIRSHDNIILDGDHRYIIAKHYGIKRVLCRKS